MRCASDATQEGAEAVIKEAVYDEDTRSYDYYANGNIKYKINQSPTFQYGTGNTAAAGNAGPHAVTSAYGYNYTYDNNGNVTRRENGGGDWSEVWWTAFNKPRTMLLRRVKRDK